MNDGGGGDMKDETVEERIARRVSSLSEIFGEPWGPVRHRYVEDPNTFDADTTTEVKFGNFSGWLEVTFFGNGDISVATHIGHDAQCGFLIDYTRDEVF